MDSTASGNSRELLLVGKQSYPALVCLSSKVLRRVNDECARKAQERMASGASPESLLDNWVLNSQKEKEKYQNDPLGTAPVEFSTEEIALTILTFLFASQVSFLPAASQI